MLSRKYKGSRKPVRLTTPCQECNRWRLGFGIELEPGCDKCKHETAWFDKLWVCGCKCNDDWVPQQVGDPEFDLPAAKKKRQVAEQEAAAEDKTEDES
jgi:hypothetical protein